MVLRRRFDITTCVRVGNRFIKGASDILPLEDIVFDVTTIVWPLWAVRAPLIGVALEHIYSLSIHKFRPAFLQVIPDHREWRCNTGYYFASYTYTILSSTGYHVKSRPTWSTGLGRYR